MKKEGDNRKDIKEGQIKEKKAEIWMGGNKEEIKKKRKREEEGEMKECLQPGPGRTGSTHSNCNL
jgi:hypothetical protein